jgi:hypothetical protein
VAQLIQEGDLRREAEKATQEALEASESRLQECLSFLEEKERQLANLTTVYHQKNEELQAELNGQLSALAELKGSQQALAEQLEHERERAAEGQLFKGQNDQLLQQLHEAEASKIVLADQLQQKYEQASRALEAELEEAKEAHARELAEVRAQCQEELLHYRSMAEIDKEALLRALNEERENRQRRLEALDGQREEERGKVDRQVMTLKDKHEAQIRLL